MAASSLMTPGGSGPRRKSPVTFGRVLAVVGLGLVVAIVWNMLSWQSVSDRPNEMKTTRVILPPPPPPPPPPKPEEVEQPPEPTIAPPLEQPLDTPPPPDQAPSQDSAPGDSALTAREGAGPSDYGLQRGTGTGTVIGGRAGGGMGDAHRAYAAVAQRCVQGALQGDRDLTRSRYAMQVAVTFEPDGRIAAVRPTSGGEERRNARVQEVLTGLQCPPPPPGLPVVRLNLNARSGG
ncbi:TonB-dependent receptor [Sandaracinobacter sp. RS1-74]|uniref:TonB-dependent receptor n=1 Tax=Sandaracinobacteroides sayramensis TaxID=2913411 RepID=UPI001EDA7089|nr:TonB-dependent receptor [Sandaracinobacteroides sayramensis]MCG2842564.1 TonB-dependent receptor [Sandaracinobacteroides sayramensis]